MNKPHLCSVCSGVEFVKSKVLWDALIDEWELSSVEVDYINDQQGKCCSSCGSNVRSVALAKAICSYYAYDNFFQNFAEDFIDLKVLEINEAGNLHKYLEKIPNYKFISYPEYDLLDLKIPSNSFDLVVHSDTLEHVKNPFKGLSEILRILKHGGVTIFTVPIIVGRLTRSRSGMKYSYHGSQNLNAYDQRVYSEFGADIWGMVLEVGFSSCQFISYEFPSGISVIAKK